MRNLTKETAAKMPKARAALSPTIIISAEETTASRICVCATNGLRRMMRRTRRGRKASIAASTAASVRRSVTLSSVSSTPRGCCSTVVVTSSP